MESELKKVVYASMKGISYDRIHEKLKSGWDYGEC